MAETSLEMLDREELGDVRRMRPPDRKQLEEDTEAINVFIREKEAEMKALNLRSDESVAGDHRGIRREKEVTIGRRKHIDNELREVNQQISKQMENLTKIQSTLAYKNEDRMNEAIRRLDHQLKTNNFTLREEKKIVAEIDRMKRSKKALVQYNALKYEIDGFRGRQRVMREERDRLFKLVTALKTREEELKRKTSANRVKAEEIKTALDILYERRRHVVAEFKRAEQEFNDVRKESRRHYRDELNRKREEERRQQQDQYQKDLAEYEASREPYEDEKQLCSTLIAYLQPHLVVDPATPGGDTSPRGTSSEQAGAIAPEKLTVIDAASGVPNEKTYILLKKDEDQCLFRGIVRNKPNKRSKREKRRCFNKPMVHTPEIFAQFASIGLTAPSHTFEVGASIDVLQDKKRYFDSLPPPPTRPCIHIDSGTDAPSDGSAPSYAESAISESIPSTPETGLDTGPPRFPRVGDVTEDGAAQWPLPRKLSHDSGLCELDGSDDMVASPSAVGQHHTKHRYHQGPPPHAPASPGAASSSSSSDVTSQCVTCQQQMEELVICSAGNMPAPSATSVTSSVAVSANRTVVVNAPPAGEVMDHNRLLSHLSLS